MEKEKLCSIIQDILPLYEEDKVSEVSKVVIEQHLRECSQCSKIRKEEIEKNKSIGGFNAQNETLRFKEIASKLKSRRRKKALMIVLVCSILIISTNIVFTNYKIPFSSMEPTIEAGKNCFINKLAYKFSKPKNNDIAYVGLEVNNSKWNDVYRIIGVPGDTVLIKDGYVYVNGELLEEDYLIGISEGGIASQEITIKENEYFIMGDDVNNAYDSRYFGCIDNDSIMGEVLFVW